jgi:hypothetical protein
MPMTGSSGTHPSISKDFTFSPKDIAIHSENVFQETELHSSHVLPASEIAPRTSDLAPKQRTLVFPDWNKLLGNRKPGKHSQLSRGEIPSMKAAINGSSALDKDLSDPNGQSTTIERTSTNPFRSAALVQSCRNRIGSSLVTEVRPNVFAILSERPTPLLQGQEDCVASAPAIPILWSDSEENWLNMKVSLSYPTTSDGGRIALSVASPLNPFNFRRLNI